MTIRKFGVFEGEDILEIAIESADACAKVITWGAVVRAWLVKRRPVVLGFETLDEHVKRSGHFGAVAGRFANRIRDGRFVLDGRTVQLDRNQRGAHHLHGGRRGFGERPWRLVSASRSEVHLSLVSEEGDMGYPGRLTASCRYSLEDPATLRIELTAETDAPTPVNLTNHCYFNLDGSRDILDHLLTMNASFVTPVDTDLIPTGAVMPVEDGPYDFRTPRRIGDGLVRYDINYVLDRPGPGPDLFHAATLQAQSMRMEAWTTEPGMQLYDAHTLGCAGVCLEAQRFPASPNIAHFPSSILRPGEVYRHVTEYRAAALPISDARFSTS